MLIMKHFFIKNVKNVTLYYEDNLYFKFYQSMKQNKKNSSDLIPCVFNFDQNALYSN